MNFAIWVSIIVALMIVANQVFGCFWCAYEGYRLIIFPGITITIRVNQHPRCIWQVATIFTEDRNFKWIMWHIWVNSFGADEMLTHGHFLRVILPWPSLHPIKFNVTFFQSTCHTHSAINQNLTCSAEHLHYKMWLCQLYHRKLPLQYVDKIWCYRTSFPTGVFQWMNNNCRCTHLSTGIFI